MFEDISDSSAISAENLSKSERMIQSSNSRKKKEKKEDHRKVLMVILVLLVISVAVGAFILKVNGINISGNENGIYTDEEIRDAAGSGKFRIILFPGKEDIKETLEKDLPYLDGVTVDASVITRTLTINVNYAVQKYAVVLPNGSYAILNENLKVLSAEASQVQQGTILITGMELTKYEPGTTAEFLDSKAQEEIIDLTNQLALAGITDIKEYDVTDTRDVSVYLNDGGEIQIGALSSLSDEKTALIKNLYDTHKAEGSNHLYIIDVKTKNYGFTRELDETVEVTVDSREILTDENGEAVTDENGSYVYAGEDETGAVEESATAEEEATGEETTEEATTEEETTENPLAKLHSSTAGENTEEQIEDTVPVTEETENPLANLHKTE